MIWLQWGSSRRWWGGLYDQWAHLVHLLDWCSWRWCLHCCHKNLQTRNLQTHRGLSQIRWTGITSRRHGWSRLPSQWISSTNPEGLHSGTTDRLPLKQLTQLFPTLTSSLMPTILVFFSSFSSPSLPCSLGSFLQQKSVSTWLLNVY